ncbi:MAG: response regulator, partial [Mogibacterium sp.]|nr:response regulator [Mogibacterium sp.]
MIRILICDDESSAVMEYEDRIRNLGAKHGVELSIKSFSNAEQLFFYMEDAGTIVDLIYMDIKMPGMDGITAAAKLRESGYNGEIIFLT